RAATAPATLDNSSSTSGSGSVHSRMQPSPTRNAPRPGQAAVVTPGSTGSIAEDGCVVADPVPQGRRAAEAGIRHEGRLVELAGVEADRADQELSTAVGVLLVQARE